LTRRRQRCARCVCWHCVLRAGAAAGCSRLALRRRVLACMTPPCPPPQPCLPCYPCHCPCHTRLPLRTATDHLPGPAPPPGLWLWI
jgi:hypothetical protein